MIRLFLAASLASALWPGLASPQGSTVSEAARQLAQEAADARLPFDGELAESAIEDVLRGYGELEDPPERQIIVARVEQELDNRVALALGQGDVGEAAYAMEHFLPVLLPLLGAPAARRWTDRYIQLVEQSPWELRNVLQDAAGTIDLIAALAAAGEADAATQISQAALERIDQELSAAGFELDAEIWSSGFAFAEAVGDDGVASRYRDHAARLLLASPDTVLPHALLNWYRPWRAADLALARQLSEYLPPASLADAVGINRHSAGELVSTRLAVASGGRDIDDAIQSRWPASWTDRADADREMSTLIQGIVLDQLGSGDRDGAIQTLLRYQFVMLEVAGVRLVELWGQLEDCERASAAAQITAQRYRISPHLHQRLAFGEDTGLADMANTIAHTDADRSIAMNRPGGWLARMGAVLVRCGQTGAALSVQAGPSWQRTIAGLEIEADILALWQTVRSPEDRQAIEQAIWARWPYPTYEFERVLIPLVPLLQVRRSRSRAAELQVLLMMVRGMPDRATSTWAPIYRAVVWNDLIELDDEDRLLVMLQLAASMPE